jgi:hypothetical protein
VLAQWIAAVALVLLSGAYLIRRAVRKRREGAVCDRCAAAAHVRMAKRPATPAAADPRKP